MTKRKQTAEESSETDAPVEPDEGTTFTPLDVPDVFELPDDERARQTQFKPLTNEG